MAVMRSANPALGDATFDFGSYERAAAAPAGAADPPAPTMTLFGTASKSLILVCLVAMAALFTFRLALPGDALTAEKALNLEAALPWVIGGAIAGLVLAIVTISWKRAAPVTAPLYAVAEGLFLGGISAMFESMFQGIVLQAAGLTFGTLAALLGAYMTGLIKPTENFKLGVVAATGGIALVYIVSIVLNLFGAGMPYIHDAHPIGIAFSVFVIIIAALNLVLDFDFIERGVERGAPRHMEWYAGFGLLVTLIWLYIEFLHLLAKIAAVVGEE